MPPRYVFTLVPGFDFRTRALGFLEETSRDDLDASAAYEALKANKKQLVNSRFKHWLDRQVFRKYFHEFSGNYSACFVFKWEERHIPNRLYGFICHPRPSTAPFFELCTLCFFATKGDETDYAILDRILRLSVDPDVMDAIAQEFSEYRNRGKQWTN